MDTYALIGKLPKPRKGWTLPGHNYTGPYNPLNEQLDYDQETGTILKIHRQPTGTLDVVAKQHDVDCVACAYRGEKYSENIKNVKMQLTITW